MNPLTIKLTTASLLAIASCLSTATAQDRRTDRPLQTTTTNSADLASGVFVASIDAEDRSLRRYAGRKLLNTEGAELGEIRDFVVHPPTSRIHYVVVSSGGVLGGMGNSLRLVPIEAVRITGPRDTFEVDILHSAWLQIPPISDENYVIDRFDLSPTHHQQLVQRFGVASRNDQLAVRNDQPVGPVLATASPNDATGLIRASVLRGKAVRLGDRKVGDIENIILDLARGTAAALLDASGDFTGTTAKYLVPLSRLAFDSPRQDPIGTTLTRADFDRAAPSHWATTGVATATQPRMVEPVLTPTGRTSPSAAAPVSDDLTAAARIVRRAIDNDPTLVAERVQVRAEDGRIVLSGSVRNEITRNKLERAARQALPAGNIENQVIVENR